ncbi:MAG: Gfo/Idh/MocA family oxidoreductase [Candidatus Omnitrophica bacterium]|nr:Gfo/Idh/MocA family oxidoreductase [Candidatus Omnitrophota bacterium]
MQKKLRVAILGGGMFFEDVIGQSFVDFCRGGLAGALSSIGMSHWAPKVADIKVEVVAVGTRNPEKGTAGKVANFFKNELPGCPITPYYGQQVYLEILEKEEPDVLFVAMPDHLHTQAILAALDKSVHVITEKPLCLKTVEADTIIEKAREKGLVVAVDLHKRYDPAVRDLMSSCLTKYEKIYRIRAVLEEPLAVSTEVFEWVEHSNPFAYVGSHWLDVVAYYLGVFPRSLFATGEKNLLVNWDKYVKEVARRLKRPLSSFPKQEALNAWDSLNVNITYDNGLRGDFNNAWINPPEFEGAVNQEIEVYGILGRGMVDQQDRGYREAVMGDGSRTRNPFFAGRIKNIQGYREVFGYGKASIVAGLLAISRVKFFQEDQESLAGSYPEAASQRSVTMAIEAATVVAEKNYQYLMTSGKTPVTAAFSEDSITIIDPYSQQREQVIYHRRPLNRETPWQNHE